MKLRELQRKVVRDVPKVLSVRADAMQSFM